MQDHVDDAQPLSETQRILNTFVAPTRAFTDMRRSAAWWLPFLLGILGSYLLTAAIQSRVGWPQLVQNEIHAQPALAERLASLSPPQLATQQKAMRLSFQYGFYAAPLINLASVALIALILWMTINFGFGGSAQYPQVLCVAIYSALPNLLAALLAAGLLFAGRDPESFTTQTMVGSNPGYYLDTPGIAKTLLSMLDFFTLWNVILLSLGLAVVARTKRSAGFAAVIGWFVVVVIVRTALVALRG